MAFTMHRPAGGPELSVVVPTFSERDNIELLLAPARGGAMRDRVGSNLRR